VPSLNLIGGDLRLLIPPNFFKTKDKMSYAASIVSTSGSIATYAKKMALNGRPAIEIVLENHNDGKIYTTFDPIKGAVNITAPHNARFDEIRITFEGSTRTWTENLAPHATKSRTTATHNFLKLSMPIPESSYPLPRIAEAGKTYTFPFNVSIYHLRPSTSNTQNI
jgi:hypothetical protein